MLISRHALNAGAPDILNQRDHIVCAVDDVGAVILECEHDAVIGCELRQLANRVDDEAATVLLPEAILVERVRVVVRGARPSWTVMPRHAAKILQIGEPRSRASLMHSPT